MIALGGYLAILVALAASLSIVLQSVRLKMRGIDEPRGLKWPVVWLVVGAVAAFGILEIALLSHDFSIAYVAENNARATPLIFTIASGWAALEGSIVLWGLVLAGYTAWVLTKLHRGEPLGNVAMAVMGLVAVFFFGLMATVANPFETLSLVPPDGTGPNALLQNNLLMAVHPPLLYMGFVGMTVPFAFAISALINGTQGSSWLQRTHRTTLVAWSFLTGGIVMGALWSYVVLGWGGYWAWDPVENASLLPWLAATAFIHSAAVQRRRGMLQAWNIALVLATFALTLLGTFLTRSGVIASVHSFTQSAVGPAFLGFLTLVLVASFGIFAWRAHLVGQAPRLESLASREGVFLANNLLLTLFAFVVLIGTIYPILLEAFTGDQVSVGRPFFDRGAVPLALVLLLAMGLGPVTPYRVARLPIMWERLRAPTFAALSAGALAILAGLRHLGAVTVLVLAVFITTAIGRHLWTLAGKSDSANRAASAWRLLRSDSSYWGGQMAHIGVGLIAIAITFSSVFAERGEVSLVPGESAEFGRYTITYEAPFSADDGYREVIGASLAVSDGDKQLVTLKPTLNTFGNQVQPVPSPALRVGLTEDLYVTLTRIDSAGISLDLFRNPLQWLLWAGGFVVVGGGIWALAVPKPSRQPQAVLGAP